MDTTRADCPVIRRGHHCAHRHVDGPCCTVEEPCADLAATLST